MTTILRLGLIVAFVAALPVAVQAEDYLYTTNNGTITITKYIGSGGAATITNTINGLPVTSIGGRAFYYCTSVTGITIPNTVTNIGDYAFSGCALTSVTIPDGVMIVGKYAFQYCWKMTDASIPDSVIDIGDCAFLACNKLANVSIGINVTRIGRFAFSSCALTSVAIPNKTASIGDGAFAYCNAMTSIAIPASVTKIGYRAFDSCSHMTGITVNASNAVYSSAAGVLFDKDQTLLVTYPGGKTGQYVVPSCVTSIWTWAFSGCEGLTCVTIPESVTSIGAGAFSSCYGLVNVTIPDGVTRIENESFYYCTGLTSVTIGSCVASIGDFAFWNCARLTGIYFRGRAPTIGSSAFDGDILATVYVLSGSGAWDPTFGERPVVHWRPQVPPDADFGVGVNGFEFTITNAGSPVVVVEACTNLIDPAWSPVGTNTLTGGSSCFSDPEWTNYPTRFYRFQMP